jgi:hypothetical protein
VLPVVRRDEGRQGHEAVKWTVTVWGFVPSLNDIYHVVSRRDSSGRMYKGIAKTPKAVQYQQDAVLQIRAAKPSRWAPEGFVRLTYRYYVVRALDLDNAKKILSDAMQTATGVNDTWYLSTDQFRVIVPKSQARVEIDVEDLPASASPEAAT